MPATLSTRPARTWHGMLPWLGLLAALLVMFYETAQSMVAIWIRSETFTHAFLVAPISAWLVWRRRDALSRLQARPDYRWLIPVAAACALWILGELATVNAATQLAFVTLIVLSVPLVFGWTIARAIAFPLLFLFFAVPLGEFMVPPMMEWTADFTVAALRATGVPVYREGLQFVIPSGHWSVVDACSGVRYLLASLMVGTLFAYLNFNSNRRRIAMIGLSLVVPVVANWLRAYMIVMLGHLSGNRIAAGVDHLIYGWVFFGIVIGAMFFIGSRWAEPEVEPAALADVTPARSGPARAWAAAAVAGALGAGTLVGLDALSRPSGRQVVFAPLPQAMEGGWMAVPPSSLADWTPAFENPSATARAAYGDGDDLVGLWVGYYRDQGPERKLVSSTNDVVAVGRDSDWARTIAGTQSLTLAGNDVTLRTASLRSSAVGTMAAQRMRAWHVYWVGGRLVPGDARAKIHQALDRLTGRGDDGAIVVMYTPMVDDRGAAAADERLQRFAAASLPVLLPRLKAMTAR